MITQECLTYPMVKPDIIRLLNREEICKEHFDWRDLKNGHQIPSEKYCDGPYVVKTDDGAWLCTVTTSGGHEGESGQHVISMRSSDQGKTWTTPVDVEPACEREASYAVLLKAETGRIYCFYNYNTENLREIKTEDGGTFSRVDCQGDYVFKYSDDHGRSWSHKRYPIDLRAFDCDMQNVYGGEIRFFWVVGMPIHINGGALLTFCKVGAMGFGFYAEDEGSFLFSPDIMTESDPEKITFDTLPDGTVGLRTPQGGGRIAEEQSIAPLSDGKSIFCVYRTADGYPTYSYSRDVGHSWDEPKYLERLDGRKLKNPRGPSFIWKLEKENKYLLWFYNNGGLGVHKNPVKWDANEAYYYRNPAWVCPAVERQTPEGPILDFGEPEILLYDKAATVSPIGYPDFVQDAGRYFVTETQKTIARSHEIPAEFIDKIFSQFEQPVNRCDDSLIYELNASEMDLPIITETPSLQIFRSLHWAHNNTNSGFTIELEIEFDDLEAGQTVLDTRNEPGQGICVRTTCDERIEILLHDGQTCNVWPCDKGMLECGKQHHIGIIVDGAGCVINFVIDGKQNDGQDDRQFGWGRISPEMRNVNGKRTMAIGENFYGTIAKLSFHNRALMASELIGNCKLLIDTAS